MESIYSWGSSGGAPPTHQHSRMLTNVKVLVLQISLHYSVPLFCIMYVIFYNVCQSLTPFIEHEYFAFWFIFLLLFCDEHTIYLTKFNTHLVSHNVLWYACQTLTRKCIALNDFFPLCRFQMHDPTFVRMFVDINRVIFTANTIVRSKGDTP